MARDASHIEVQNYGMACRPSQSRQPPSIGSRRLHKNCFPSFCYDAILKIIKISKNVLRQIYSTVS